MSYELRVKKLQSTVFCFLLIIFSFSPAFAENAKKQLSDIEEKLKTKKQQVKEAIEQEKSIVSELDRINKSLRQKQDELKKFESQISQTELNIKSTESDIVILNSKLDQKKQHLKQRLKALYKQHYGSKALILISAIDYQDLISKSRFMSYIAYQDSHTMNTFNSEIREAGKKKDELELLRTKLQTSKESVQKKKNEMSEEITKKDKLLASVRSKRSSYEKMIKELEESSEKLREMIESFEKEKPSEPIKGTGFAILKGQLPWPVEGEVLVPFGKYNDPQYNITVFKNGVEIKAASGEQPKAVSGGNVVYADWFKGYGLLLIINHGSGYHSLYGHLSEVFHKSGDIIKKGTAVGRIGDSGLSDVPSLYFEIRYKGKPVDPMQWLKKTNNRNKR